MFQPSIFREQRTDVMQALIRQHPFAILISLQQGQIVADHLPLVIHPELATQGVLRGHLSRANPIARELQQEQEVLVVFSGPQHYITPAWYASKQEHGKVVPTWNYITVHARGQISLQHDPEWIYQHLQTLSRQQEHNRPAPWAISDAPEEFIHRQLRGITGIEIEITGLQGTWKTSQNKNAADQQGVISGLKADNTEAAAQMAACVHQQKI